MLRSISDQIHIQPVEFHVFGSFGLNLNAFAGVKRKIEFKIKIFHLKILLFFSWCR